MRTKIAIRNAFFLFGTYLLTSIMNLIMRPLFIEYLNAEYLGFSSIISNIITLMSITEAGIGTSITYRLYEAFSQNNTEEITVLVNIYRKTFRLIGTASAIMGLCMIPLLPMLVKDSDVSITVFILCYLAEMLATVINYYIGYYRLVYVSNQKEYICVSIEAGVNIFISILQIVAVIKMQNYVIYVCLNALKVLLPSVLLLLHKKKEYPYLYKRKISRNELLERNFIGDIKNAAIQQVAYIFHGGVDSVIVSGFFGLSAVARFNNYIVIDNFVRSATNKIFKPLQAAVGNFVYSKDDIENKRYLFRCLDFVVWFIGIFVFCSYIVIFQPFITIWMGEDFLLSKIFVSLLALNAYVAVIGTVGYSFRTSVGAYDYDRKYAIAAAILNLVISVILGGVIGESGVIFGTVVSSSLITYGRNKVTFKKILFMSQKEYYRKQGVRLFVTIMECAIVYFITEGIPKTLVGIMVRLFIVTILTIGLNYYIFRKNEEIQFIKKCLFSIRNR